METHTVLGEQMLAASRSCARGVDVVRSHHERWDGARAIPDGRSRHRDPARRAASSRSPTRSTRMTERPPVPPRAQLDRRRRELQPRGRRPVRPGRGRTRSTGASHVRARSSHNTTIYTRLPRWREPGSGGVRARGRVVTGAGAGRGGGGGVGPCAHLTPRFVDTAREGGGTQKSRRRARWGGCGVASVSACVVPMRVLRRVSMLRRGRSGEWGSNSHGEQRE
jgi:hypothetical protein